jgi:ABC-type sugar transport system substrate-binding protein
MNRKLMTVMSILVVAGLMLAGCAPKAAPVATEAPVVVATEAPAEGTEAAITEDTVVSMVPAKAGSPFDITGKKVCYIIPALANPFLNGVATSVTAQAAADGVEVSVYGADEGGLNTQFNQIENCISMGVDFMYVMAAGEIDQLIPAIEEAKAAGIMVMGVPPPVLKPFDAIMHTSQFEDGQKVVKMACDFIEAVYPDAADKSVETVVIGGENANIGMHERYRGYRTIEDTCPKAKVVQYIDISVDSLAAGQAAAETALTANPNIKVFVIQSTAQAQGAANAIKALPNVDVSQYGVFAGDMDPSMIPTVSSCQDPYKGFVAIGGKSLDIATYEQIKKMLQGVEYPNIINDALEPITCDFSTLK